MSEEDKKLQKHLVDEMMKVYETNPDVMLYMQSLMENYEKLEQENKQLKERIEYLERSNNRREDTIIGYRLEDIGIVAELEEWLNKEKSYYLYGRTNEKTLLYGKELQRIETIEKIKELKEKYK